MPDRLDEALKWGWGFEHLRNHQRQAIEAALKGQDSMVVLPTGGGKSICYQLPALVGEAPTLVVSPLIALMEDQVQAARQAVSAAALHSDQPMAMQHQILRDYRAGKIRLLYTSPERLAHSRLVEDLEGFPPALVAVDEAHCISSWGHDFRPEYRQLAQLLEPLKAPRMALTATATPQVADDVCDQLKLSNPLRIVAPVHRANLTLSCVPRHDRRPQIERLLEVRRGQCGIVYCRRRKDTEELAAYFETQGHRCAPFHAGLAAATKRNTLAAFMQDRLDVVFATIAFGMGIDRPDVRFVIHASMPSSIEAYVQEAGRAGRDGAPADCICLYGGDDVRTALYFINEEDPAPDRRHSLEQALWGMRRYTQSLVCRHRQISEHFGQALQGEGTCGAVCDVCCGDVDGLAPAEVEVIAETVAALITAVGERFGRGHIAGILSGSKAEKIRRWNHHQHALHGRLKRYGEKGVMQLLDQLETHGLIITGESNGYPVLCMGSTPYDAQRPPQLMLTPTKAPKKSAPASLSSADARLFDRLKAWRSDLASARGVPAYVIATDRSLKHLAANRPTSRQELQAIHGFGAVKVEALADEILPLIQSESESNP